MIAHFALRLACGLALMWCLSALDSESLLNLKRKIFRARVDPDSRTGSRRDEITAGYFRIQMLITLGLSVLAALTSGQAPHGTTVLLWTGAALAGLSFLGSVMWTLQRRGAGMLLARIIALVSTASLVGVEVAAVRASSESSAGMLFHGIADALTSAGIIGSVTAAMLLGHWYLTATGMSLSPLIQFNRLFTGAVILRSLFAVGSMLAGEVTAGSGMLLILRWAGLLGPFILALLTVQILKYRNTQSATGVLYAATILVYMGETAAALLGVD
jgi:hypothetical protein